jgi:chemotaxis-related protein WspD
MDSCWNTKGVRGDMTCPELERHVHCRNCPVHASAAAELLRRASPDDSLAERTSYFAQPKRLEERASDSIVIFRVGGERLALPTAVIKEVMEPRPVHSLPHRRSRAVLGVTNVRGELVAAVDLSRLLGLSAAGDRKPDPQRRTNARMLVLAREAFRIACPVDDVFGVQRTSPAALQHVPASLANATARYSKGLLSWDQSKVSLLDHELLFYTLRRCVA